MTPHRLLLSAILLALWLPAQSPAAGPREFSIQNWTRDDGLPGSSVTAVTQTPEGYLWISTLTELARFDGLTFKVWPLHAITVLGDAPIVHLFADSQANLWIGALDGRLMRFRDGHVTPSELRIKTSSVPYCQSLAEEVNGTLWALGEDSRLSRASNEGFTHPPTQPGPKPTELNALIADNSSGLWLAAGDALLRSTNGSPQVVWDAAHDPGFKPEALAPARTGGCWVAANGKVRRFLDGRCVETRGPFAWKNSVWGLLEDREANVWLATYGGGLTVFADNGSVKLLTRAEGLPGDIVRCLSEDREGNLWAGFEGQGLARIRHATFSSYGHSEGLSGEVVLCACEGANGEIWLGSNGKGIKRLQGGEVRRYGPADGLDNECVWALQMGRDGKLWAGTWGNGLFRMEGERFVNVSSAMGLSDVVLALHEDWQGSLWLGQKFPSTRRVEAIIAGRKHSFNAPGASASIDVRAIAETPDGAICFGTSGAGLLRWDGTTFRQFGVSDGLPSGAIHALHVDHAGALWLGVVGCGLVLCQQERFFPVTPAEGLPSNLLTQITDDHLGYLWCGSRDGVFRAKLEDLHRFIRREQPRVRCRLFTKTDGLPNSECSGPGCRARDGHIWFPTVACAAILDPRRVPANLLPPPVLIEQARWDDKPVSGALQEPRSVPLRLGPGLAPVYELFQACFGVS